MSDTLYWGVLTAIAQAIERKAVRPLSDTELPDDPSALGQAKRAVLLRAYAWATFPLTSENTTEWNVMLDELVEGIVPLVEDDDVSELVDILERDTQFHLKWRIAKNR